MAYYDPTFDVNFAYGDNPVSKYGFTFTRATSATYVNASGLIATAASGELRYTYDPVTLSALGVLIEEQRTNLVIRSSEIDNGSWNISADVFAFGSGSVANSVATLDPAGTNTAELLTEKATTASHYASILVTTSASTAYTFSVFVKANNRGYATIQVNDGTSANAAWCAFNLTTGVVSQSPTMLLGTFTAMSASTQKYGNGWWRCIFTLTTNTVANCIMYVGMSDTGTQRSYAGDGTSGIFVWGAQCELGAFATSYIPTTGTAATRNADVLPLTGAADVVAPWFNKDAGTWLVERYGSPAAIASAVCVDDGAATNRILVRQDASRVPHFIVGSTADVTGSAVVAGSAFKTAAAYAANDVSVSIGGGAVSTDATVTLPAGMTTARIGSSSAGEYANAPISRIRYYNSRIPDDDLLLLSNGVDLSTPLKGGRARKRLVYIVKQDDDLDSLIESLSQESVRDYL